MLPTAARTWLAPLPNSTPLETRVEEPVPPLLTAKVPVKPKDKVLLAMVPVMLVSLFTKPTRVVPRVEELVPPLAIGKRPVISAEPPPRLIAPLTKFPAMERTFPVPREAMVVEPETLRKVMLVVARVEEPLTVKKLEIVVEPVTVRVLEVGLKVKLLEPAVEEAAVA